MMRLLRGSVIASLLILSTNSAIASPSLAERALSLQLDRHPVWHALLHLHQDKNRISDPHFLLSHEQFSARQELVLSIQTLLAESAPLHCRFPARDYWLRQQLSLPERSYADCPDLIEFQQKAPLDQLSVVYGAENLTSASSMMGHVLFKIAGQTPQGQRREHAISFYTDVRGINLPKIMYDSTIKGKKGYFALSPYPEKHDHYTLTEQRNVWVYDIRLTESQRQLIQYHLWELRQTQLKYFFHTYNCATFTRFILALTGHPLLAQQQGWQSPLDVIKAIDQSGLVQHTSFFPSPRARIRMLTQQRSWAWKQQILHAIASDQPDQLPVATGAEDQYLLIKTVEALTNDHTRQQQTSAPAIAQYLQQAQQTANSSYTLDVSAYKSPLKSPLDSQIYLRLDRQSDTERVVIGFLPASHALDDDQRQNINNSQLRIADFAVSITPKTQKIRIEQFDLYAMTTYMPYDPLTGGISSHFKLGYQQHYTPQLERYHALYLEGGIGLSYDIHPDITVAALANAKIDRPSDLHATFFPELSVIINSVFDSKTILQHRSVYPFNQNTQPWYQTGVVFAIPINSQHRLSIHSTHLWNRQQHQSTLGLTWKWLF